MFEKIGDGLLNRLVLCDSGCLQTCENESAYRKEEEGKDKIDNDGNTRKRACKYAQPDARRN